MPGYRKKPIVDRLMEKIEIVSESGCWIWMGATTDFGYGTMMVRRKVVSTHRLMAQEMLGDVNGKVVCHRCDVPSCINPDHLYIGTSKQNTADIYARGRENPARGEQAGHAKLKDHEVLEIRASEERVTDLAKKFKISPSIISQIRSRQIWRHL